MKERRSLIDGLKTDPELKEVEEAFVFGTKRKPDNIEALRSHDFNETRTLPTEDTSNRKPSTPVESRILPQMTGRIPVTTRCRPEVASALKRASLQRQLAGIEPYYVQDIMEAALEHWLEQNGFSERYPA